MAWNGSQGAAKPQKVAKKANPSAWRGLLAAIIVIGGAAGVCMYFFGGEVNNGILQGDEAAQNKKIAEVAPKLSFRPDDSTGSEAGESKPETKEKKALPPQRVGELRDGYRLLPDGTLHRVLGIITNTPPKMSLADKTFTHSADIELGNLLMVEPGDDLLGDTEGMYKGFGKELDEALSEQLYYDADDTELQRELKDGVHELREELRRRRDAGEDIEKIMEETRDQLKELSLYRQELEDQVRELATDDLTQKDYEDLVNAANQMLEDRGIKPLEMPSTLKHAIRLRQIQENAAKRDAEKEEENQNAKQN